MKLHRDLELLARSRRRYTAKGMIVVVSHFVCVILVFLYLSLKVHKFSLLDPISVLAKLLQRLIIMMVERVVEARLMHGSHSTKLMEDDRLLLTKAFEAGLFLELLAFRESTKLLLHSRMHIGCSTLRLHYLHTILSQDGLVRKQLDLFPIKGLIKLLRNLAYKLDPNALTVIKLRLHVWNVSHFKLRRVLS